MYLKTIVIAGGTGLIGTRLKFHLENKGYKVWILTRGKPGEEKLTWNPYENELPPELKNADAIVNLAGASVYNHRWTKRYKKEILDGRVLSTRALVSFLQNRENSAKVFFNASATGFYGADKKMEQHEDFPPGSDFLSTVCVKWENEALRLKDSSVRLLIYRFGIVLSSKEGALPQLVRPIKYRIGALLGRGSQVVSWIHIDDLCRMIIYGLENAAMQGIYNAVAPEELSQEELMTAIAAKLNRSLLPFKVPAFFLRLLLGEFAKSILGSNPVSCSKVLKAGFWFQFPRFKDALNDLCESEIRLEPQGSF